MDGMKNDDLAEYLNALQREDRYRVDAVVKESSHEVTQQVSFIGENGAERGPFIRKLINRETGMGGAYERLYAAQQEGRRFKFLPIILECYMRDDVLVVVMEYVHGETLQDLVYRCDPSEGLACEVFPQLCDAVSELHEDFDPPIIHRDLKPSNVIMSQGGCTIIDFGIAREFKDGAQADTVHFGTRAFAPPEQFGFGQTTVRSDVYALGMLLYFCLTETIPDTGNRASWYEDQRVPISLRGVIAKATAFDPQQRYSNVRELKAAFLAAGCEGAFEGEAADLSHAHAAQGPAVVNDVASPDAQQEPHVSPASPLQPSDSIDDASADSDQAKAPHVLGRIWNVFVLVAFAGLCAYLAYMLATGGFTPPGHAGDIPWHIAAVVIDVVLFASLAFACLDKRRLRKRFPALASLKAWQAWAVVLVVYVIANVFTLLT